TASPQSLTVIWPSGKTTRITHLQPDQLLRLAEKEAGSDAPATARPAPSFTDITAASGLSFRHQENDFVDFKAEVLLPYELSREGPALAKADVNGDGLEDIYVGGAIGQPGTLFLQTSEARFTPAPGQPWDTDSVHEQVNALFFDVDNDGDMDLYIVSGGNEYADQSDEYQDQLYINDGKGHFSKAPAGALPPMPSSKLAIAAGDFDHDGDIDLFVGGRGMPGSFPLPSKSYLLRNDSQAGNIHFTDVTDEVAPGLRQSGMVTAAAWVDANNDHYPELLLAGDWMPVMLFDNKNGKLTDISSKAGLSGLGGMWSSITPLTGGDLLLGNAGYNGQFRASGSEPMRLYVTDIDGNGSIDPIFCYYIKGKSYPMASRDELLDQVTALRKKFIRYSDYADATIEDIVPKNLLQNARVLTCEQLATGILHSKGDGRYGFQPLPPAVQFSKVFAAVSDDFDGDGVPDLLTAGNFYPYRTQLGQCDASLGLLLHGSATGYRPVDPAVSGLYIGGDIRRMVEIKDPSGQRLLVIGKNDDTVQVIKINAK
ncbi:MAG: VCBS repeat-containing protein, partial [Bacteroidetes bacterium]|nr:VCBS repeat-containing protein [Bacteroidota bacterium]